MCEGNYIDVSHGEVQNVSEIWMKSKPFVLFEAWPMPCLRVNYLECDRLLTVCPPVRVS